MMGFKNISVIKKLIAIQLVTAFVAVLLSGSIFVVNDIKLLETNSIASKNSIAEIIGINSASALEFSDVESARLMLEKLQSTPSILNAIILDKNGREFARYDKNGVAKFDFLNAPSGPKGWFDFNNKFVVNYKIINKEFLGMVMLRSEITGFRTIILGYLEIALIILFISLVGAFLISTLLQRSITNRLLALVYKTKEIVQTRNYSVRADIGGKDELAELSITFNKMLAQIEDQNQEITSLNQNLEHKVLQRTKELELANKELEAFSYSVSHDLRAPLRAISGYSNILKEDFATALNIEGHRLLTQIGVNSEKMGQLIDDLLAFSKLGRKEIARIQIDMNELCQQVVEELNNSIEHKANIKINVPATVLADRPLMKQVITNLLSNAIKYSSKKEQPIIDISLKKDGHNTIFIVADNGVGFDMKYKNKLFGVFERLHSDKEFQGTGVGLAIVERIITRHGGRIWAESQLGEGAAFYFTLSDILPN